MPPPNANGQMNARGMAGSFIIAAVTAGITVFATDAIKSPRDLSTVQADVNSLRSLDAIATLARDKIAVSQSDVRERLQALESSTLDRYRGSEARAINNHFKQRIESLLRRIERLESIYYSDRVK